MSWIPSVWRRVRQGSVLVRKRSRPPRKRCSAEPPSLIGRGVKEGQRMPSNVAFQTSRVGASEGRGCCARMGLFRKGRRLHPEGRRWAYATKPTFARLKGPITDALDKAEEVRVIVGLGDFSRGNIHLRVEPNRYLISAKSNHTEFLGEIPLPRGVDLRRRVEHLENGILELVLPGKTRRGDGRQERKGNNARRPLHSGD